ncbi:hypothetical protein Emag_007608 [Eimeria magna]
MTRLYLKIFTTIQRHLAALLAASDTHAAAAVGDAASFPAAATTAALVAASAAAAAALVAVAAAKPGVGFTGGLRGSASWSLRREESRLRPTQAPAAATPATAAAPSDSEQQEAGKLQRQHALGSRSSSSGNTSVLG